MWAVTEELLAILFGFAGVGGSWTIDECKHVRERGPY